MQRFKDIESLYLSPEASDNAAVEYFACVYIDASIVFNDIRTGYRGTVKLIRALKVYENHAIPGWSEDIILDSDAGRIMESPPEAARLRQPPVFMDAEFINNVEKRYIEYLIRTWKKILYRNSELNIYYSEGESKEDFIVRCREQFSWQMSEELKRLRVIFNRMQKQLKEKYLGTIETELPESTLLTLEVTDRDIYSRYADYIAALFLNADSESAAIKASIPRMDKSSELEERLVALTAEARHRIALLRESYEKKAGLIDEYILRPNHKNIHCERSGVLWVPSDTE